MNLLHNFTYTAVDDLPTLLSITFSTIVIVITVIIRSYTIVIVINFNCHPALMYGNTLDSASGINRSITSMYSQAVNYLVIKSFEVRKQFNNYISKNHATV